MHDVLLVFSDHIVAFLMVCVVLSSNSGSSPAVMQLTMEIANGIVRKWTHCLQ